MSEKSTRNTIWACVCFWTKYVLVCRRYLLNLKATKTRISTEFHQNPKLSTEVYVKIFHFFLRKHVSYDNKYYKGSIFQCIIYPHTSILACIVKRTFIISLDDFLRQSLNWSCRFHGNPETRIVANRLGSQRLAVGFIVKRFVCFVPDSYPLISFVSTGWCRNPTKRFMCIPKVRRSIYNLLHNISLTIEFPTPDVCTPTYVRVCTYDSIYCKRICQCVVKTKYYTYYTVRILAGSDGMLTSGIVSLIFWP